VRRALIATVGTAVGLVLLLGYKSGTPTNGQKVDVTGGTSATTVPTAATTVPTAATTVPTAGSTGGAEGAGTTAPHSYAGQLVNYLYGDIEVAISIEGKRISNVSVVENNAVDQRSQSINAVAVPILEQEALSAQGVNFDVVTGATYTSDAFAQSLETALQKSSK
jgi:uncharacterized protein with FMN-binding domain